MNIVLLLGKQWVLKHFLNTDKPVLIGMAKNRCIHKTCTYNNIFLFDIMIYIFLILTDDLQLKHFSVLSMETKKNGVFF